MTPFYRWGLTVSMQQSHYQETVYFLLGLWNFQGLNCRVAFTTLEWCSMTSPYSKFQIFSSPQRLHAGGFLARNLLWSLITFYHKTFSTFLTWHHFEGWVLKKNRLKKKLKMKVLVIYSLLCVWNIADVIKNCNNISNKGVNQKNSLL